MSMTLNEHAWCHAVELMGMILPCTAVGRVIAGRPYGMCAMHVAHIPASCSHVRGLLPVASRCVIMKHRMRSSWRARQHMAAAAPQQHPALLPILHWQEHSSRPLQTSWALPLCRHCPHESPPPQGPTARTHPPPPATLQADQQLLLQAVGLKRRRGRGVPVTVGVPSPVHLTPGAPPTSRWRCL